MLRVGYVPYSNDLSMPGDRRRIAFWARRRGADLRVYRPGERYDVVVLSARADVDTWARAPVSSPPLIYDLIDSYLAIPRASWSNTARGAAKFLIRETARPVLDYRSAIERLCRRADGVVCSTPEQRSDLAALNANVHDILDAHGDDVQTVKHDFAIGEVVNLVWEGLPYTLGDFNEIADVLHELERERPIALHLVTDLRYRRYAGRLVRRDTLDDIRRLPTRTYLYQWNTQMLGAVLTAGDIAVVPLDLQSPLARNKPENKLLLLWRLGMPSVVSATPAYRRVMAAAGVDLSCPDAEAWASTVRRVLLDEKLRRSAAEAGRRYVETNHTEDHLLARWDAVFRSLGFDL